MAPTRIRDRAAFFGKQNGIVKLNSKERRKMKRKPLQEEYEQCRNQTQTDKKDKIKDQESEDRRIVITPSEVKIKDQESENRRIIITPSEVNFDVDIRVDKKDYEDFLQNEKKFQLIKEIKELEGKIRNNRRKEKKERKKKRK